MPPSHRIEAPFVTGAAGFIGSHLVRALANDHARVGALDSLRYGTWSNILLGPNVNTTQADLATLSLDDMCRLLDGHDTLLHLAAEKHNNAIDAPQRVLDVNVTATARLFDAAGKVGIKSVIFTSSLYAYGRVRGDSMRENDIPTPSTIYGTSKLAGEGLLREASQRHGFSASSLRLFFVYGPRQYTGMGYPSVIVRNFNRILNNEAPVIHGNGNQALDYINIADVIDAIQLAARSGATDKLYNVGSGVGITVNELTRTMLDVSNSRISAIHGPADWTAGTRRVGDPAAITRELGWAPKVSLAEGLTRVWEWLNKKA